MPRARFSHFIVTHEGKPCVLTKSTLYATDGVLIPSDDAALATQFTVVRGEKHPTIYARRRAERAITRTIDFVQLTRGSAIDEQEFVKSVLTPLTPLGTWHIQPVTCPKQPQS